MSDKTYTWDEWTNNFLDWTNDEQLEYLKHLNKLGNSVDVAGDIYSLRENREAANLLISKANDKKYIFEVNDIIYMKYYVDIKLLYEALYNSISIIKEEDILNLSFNFDEKVIADICNKLHYSIPKDEIYEENEIHQKEKINDEYETQMKKTNKWLMALGIMFIGRTIFRNLFKDE